MLKRTSAHFGSRAKKLAWAVSTILITLSASFALWDPLAIDERAHVRRMTELSTASVKADVEADMNARILAQVGLAKMWGATKSLSTKERELSAGLFLEHQPGCLLVQWVDRHFHVRWTAKRGAKADEQDIDISSDRAMMAILQEALVRGGEYGVMSPTFHQPDGRAVVRVAVPILHAGVPDGFLVTQFAPEIALASILADHTGLGYSLAVHEEGKPAMYRTPGTSREYEDAWAQDADLQLLGVNWHIRVWPNPELLANMRSPLPELSLVLGGLLGFLLVMTVYFARAADTRSKELRLAHDQLEARVRERTLELQQTNENLQAEIGERKRAEDSLRSLSGRLLLLQDQERRRIARDLHDSTVQMLGALAINLERAAMSARKREYAGVAGVLQQSKQTIDQITSEIRTVSYLLHPPMLDELGLEYVLPWYVEGFSSRSGISVDLNIQPELGRLPHEVELTLFRITQEALSNVHRHSGSRTAKISLSREGDSAALFIKDHGCGVPEGVLHPTKASISKLGVGITGMRERVRQLGGQIEITSGPDGTQVRTRLPLANPAGEPRRASMAALAGGGTTDARSADI